MPGFARSLSRRFRFIYNPIDRTERATKVQVNTVDVSAKPGATSGAQDGQQQTEATDMLATESKDGTSTTTAHLPAPTNQKRSPSVHDKGGSQATGSESSTTSSVFSCISRVPGRKGTRDATLPQPESSNEHCRVAEDTAFHDGGQDTTRGIFITIEDGGPEDYTQGPARTVLAPDGAGLCPALLVTPNLVANMKHAVLAHRAYIEAEKLVQRQARVQRIFDSEVHLHIMCRRSKLRVARQSTGNSDRESTVAALKEELEILEAMQRAERNRYEGGQARVRTQGMILRSIQTDAIAIVEEAFIFARALDPAPIPRTAKEEYDEKDESNQLIDIEVRYEKIAKARQEEKGISGATVKPLGDPIADLRVAPRSPAAQAEFDLKVKHLEAQGSLGRAQYNLRQSSAVANEVRQFQQHAVDRGEIEDDPAELADFNVALSQHEMSLKHAVEEAEAAVQVTKTALKVAGIRLAEPNPP